MAAEKLKEEGNAAFGKGEFEKAAGLYSQAIKTDELNHLLYANRAAAFLALNKFEEARADSKKCIALDAGFAKAYLRLATAERALGNKEEALRVVREGQALFQDTSGKKAKRTGLNDFRKLEKELRAELNPPAARQSQASAVQQAVQSNSARDSVQDLGQQVINAKYKLQDLQGKLMSRSRQHQEKQIVLRTLEQELASKNEDQVVTYRRLGKAYLMQPCPRVMGDLKAEMASLEAEVQSLSKGDEVLKRNVEEAQRNLSEGLRRRQQ